MEHTAPDSPPLRSTTTILGSFLRGRPRNSSQSHINTDPLRELSPGPLSPPSPNPAHRRRGPAPGPIQSSPSNNNGLGITQMLRRRRSAGQIAAQNNALAAPAVPLPGPRTATSGDAHRIRLVPHLDSRRALKFEAIARDLKDGDPALRIGRFTDRSGLGLAAVNALGTNKLAFKSKVVSRAHAEIWVDGTGKFWVKDTKSSSGTFLNHSRLSPANTESRPFSIKDGDILQLGVDYQGGAEDIYKSVKIRIEIGREWQNQANAFNTAALKNLKALAVNIAPSKSGGASKARSAIPDCCICLFGVTIQQALFIAPCSHTFHYKCIRPLLESHHPAFSCPLCRTFADLEQDVEVEGEAFEEDEDSAVEEVANALNSDPALNSDAANNASSNEAGAAAGAETEVEGDGGTMPRLRGQPAQMDLMDEASDEDMVVVVDSGVADLVMADASDGSAEIVGQAAVGSKRKR
ncbi:cytoplasmic protein [Mycena floridula]|nr:cytoplasmic protein [Mycena floridula]